MLTTVQMFDGEIRLSNLLTMHRHVSLIWLSQEWKQRQDTLYTHMHNNRGKHLNLL